MTSRAKVLKTRCPTCKKEVVWNEAPFRPFCSERCKLIDLGEWISEGYRISAPLEDESESEITREDGEGE